MDEVDTVKPTEIMLRKTDRSVLPKYLFFKHLQFLSPGYRPLLVVQEVALLSQILSKQRLNISKQWRLCEDITWHGNVRCVLVFICMTLIFGEQ